jgi:hypothetical protein
MKFIAVNVEEIFRTRDVVRMENITRALAAANSTVGGESGNSYVSKR